MDEKESSKEKLIQKINVSNKVRNNLRSPDQVLTKETGEKFLCCCFDYDLTISEYKSFVELKKKVIPSFDEKNPSHELSLQQLFNKSKNILYKNKDKEKDEQLSNNTTNTLTTKGTSNNNISEEDVLIWRKIGFQTSNPRTDFRAGGIFSLDLMNYFANNHENEFTNIIKEDYFTFALVCIRLSYLIRIYLFLLTPEEIKINVKFQKNILATRKELKNFCYFLWEKENLLFEIASITLGFIFQRFVEQKKNSNKESNYLIIDPIISSSIQCIKNTLSNANIYEDIIFRLKNEFRENFLY